MARVLVMDASYEDCRKAIRRAFQVFPLNLKGKSVAIKVNALRAAEPKEAICTDYRVLAVVLEEIREMGAAKITVGDNPGTESYGNSKPVFLKSLLFETAGPYFKNYSDDLIIREIDFPVKRRIAVNKDVLEADVYISLPKFKTHGLTIISGAVKNNFGFLPGAQKAWFHVHTGDPYKFAQALINIFSLRLPDLVIMDGILAMEGSGPASPELRYLNKILASNEAVALDTVMAYVMGLGVDDVPYLRVARERGLGETELARIEIDGESRPVAGYKVPVPAETSFSYASGVAGGKTSLAFFRSRVNLRPRIDPLKCSQPCTLCTDKCPGGALEMSRMPRFKVDKCLGCFRCCEICPVGAISLLASE